MKVSTTTGSLKQSSVLSPRITWRAPCTIHHSRASPTKLPSRSHSSWSTWSFSSLSRSCSRVYSKTATKQPCTIGSAWTRSLTSAAKTPVALINDLPRGYQEVVVDFNDGKATRFPSFWLRDHCLCSECTHPQTKQRQVDTFSLDADTKAVETQPTQSGLKVTWTDLKHTSIYPWSWLKEHTPFTPFPSIYNPRGKWQHVSPSSPEYPNVNHNSVMETDTGLSTLLSQIRTYGFSFISNTSPTASATESLCNRIAHIRQTHYGGFWEVTSQPSPIDTAYTNLSLPNHTDNTYFTEPCGLQLFHCLSHIPDSTTTSSPSAPSSFDTNTSLGGASTFVDGFSAAAYLHKTNPAAYKLLSTIPIISHASGSPTAGPFLNNILHSQGHPTFTHLPPPSSPPSTLNPKTLSQIRWNNTDRHSLTQFPTHALMVQWYEAARVWNNIIHSPQFEIVVKLQPGKPIIFDNWRVLHGRREFKGIRKLCGAYIGMDDFLAKGRLLDQKVEGDDGSVE